MSRLDIRQMVSDLRIRREGLLRMAMLGNAGGVVATLSFIGTAIGASAGKGFPEPAFNVLIIFLTGLGAGFFSRLTETQRHAKFIDFAIKHQGDPPGDPPTYELWTRLSSLGFVAAIGCMMYGIIHGLRVLSKLGV